MCVLCHLDIYQNNSKDMLQHETGKLYVVMIAMHTFTAVSDAATLFFSVNTQNMFCEEVEGFFLHFFLPHLT